LAFKGKIFIADEPIKGLKIALNLGERIVVNDTLNITLSAIVANADRIDLVFEGDKEKWHIVRGQLTGNSVEFEGNGTPQNFKHRGKHWRQTK